MQQQIAIVYKEGDRVELNVGQLIVKHGTNNYVSVNANQLCVLGNNLVITKVISSDVTPVKILNLEILNQVLVQSDTGFLRLTEELTLVPYIDANDVVDSYVLSNKLFKLQNEKVYVLDQGKFKLVSFQSKHAKYFQFCDLVFVIEWCYSLKEVKQRTYLRGITEEQNPLVEEFQDLFTEMFSVGSILILWSCDRVVVFDLIRQQLVQVHGSGGLAEQKFSVEVEKMFRELLQDINQINKYIELWSYGLQIRRELLSQIFGQSYPKAVDKYYSEFHASRQLTALNKLQKCQLMHVFRPLAYVGLYIVAEDNHLYVIDKEYNILKKASIICEIYSGYENRELYAGTIIYEGFYNQLIPCKGVLYLQVLDKIYYLKDQKLHFFMEIPDFDFNEESSQYCGFFCLNSELYMKSAKKTYLYKNNELQLVTQQEKWAFQTNSRVFTTEWENNSVLIREMVSDSVSLPVATVDDAWYPVFILNGIMIVSVYDKPCVMVNCFSKQKCEIDVDPDIVPKLVELCDSGLQIQSGIVQKSFNHSQEQNEKQLNIINVDQQKYIKTDINDKEHTQQQQPNNEQQSSLDYLALIKDQMQYQCYTNEVFQIMPLELVIKQCGAEFEGKLNNMEGKIDITHQNTKQLQVSAISTIEQFQNKMQRMVEFYEQTVGFGDW
ncbi:Conserved_hypothetical protein [Hexamita inflata]|uniref:Uncharacterized protein n=1 Tax=Hexamita inflata TaxID=28002 RepID=A0AA86UT65_9EUKA|nr:Conserved hypothetical protein [Hexamita inflata]